MTISTQRSQIARVEACAAIPERQDMIDDLDRRDAPDAEAVLAQRMRLSIRSTEL